MRTLIQNVPIPAAGVALGLAALGNLLQPYTEIAHIACGALSLCFVALLVAKIALFPALIRDDLKNSILASVSATLFMTLMQLATYLAPLAWHPAFALWAASVAGHLCLMVWFTARFIVHFKLSEVFPTYFICYALMQLRMPIMIFGIMTIVFCVIYSMVASILVYRLAPRTFRIRT